MAKKSQLTRIETAPELELAWYDLSDGGNAKRIERLAANKICYVNGKGWLNFDGQKWNDETGELVARLYTDQVVVHLKEEAAALARLISGNDAQEQIRRHFPVSSLTPEIVKDRAERLLKYAEVSGNANRADGMLKKLRPLVTIDWLKFDAEPLWFNCQNGKLIFAKNDDGEWGVRFVNGHDPLDYFTKIAAVEYDKSASSWKWQERMRKMHLRKDGDQESSDELDYLQKIYGYCLTGLTSDQSFFVHWGKGGDGKSTTHEILMRYILGSYATHADISTFLQRNTESSGGGHRTDIIALAGDYRFVLVGEPQAKAKWDMSVIKQITGGEITARQAYANVQTTFTPRFKLHCEVNDPPRMASADTGSKRRLKIKTWDHQFTADDLALPQNEVVAELRAEASGILNWLIAGALKWLGDRRIEPGLASRRGLKTYWGDVSPFKTWFEQNCVRGEGYKTLVGDLYADYKCFCEAEDPDSQYKITMAAFSRDLTTERIDRSNEYSRELGKTVNYRVGVRLKTQAERAADAANVEC